MYLKMIIYIFLKPLNFFPPHLENPNKRKQFKVDFFPYFQSFPSCEIIMKYCDFVSLSQLASPPAPPLRLKSHLSLPTRGCCQTGNILKCFVPDLTCFIMGLFALLLYFLYSRKKENSIQTQTATSKKRKKSRRRNQKRYVESLESLKEHKNEEKSLKEGLMINTKVVIGKGSGGTLVFEGELCNFPVAIKRIPLKNFERAKKEVEIMGSVGHHENIILMRAVAKDKNFVYIVLERCDLNLYELVMKHKSKDTCLNSSDDNTEIKLWMANGYPSSQLLKLMSGIVNGLACMHENGIVHLDIKPHDILIEIDIWRAKVSDMGNSKKVDEIVSDMGISKKVDEISLLKTHTGFKSLEWRAPELLSQHLAYAADLFSLGCVFFFCISGGYHPFGEEDSVCDSNIVGNISGNKKNLSRIEGIPEAKHLITCLLDPNPLSRPDIKQVSCHPLFWNSETRVKFFMASSSRLELEFRKNPDSILLQELEKTGKVGDWSEKMDSNFLKTITTVHKPKVYQFSNVRNLVRLIRKASLHYYNYPDNIQKILGKFPEEFLYKFSEKFPNLFMAVYKVIETHCKEEFGFKMYFTPTKRMSIIP